MANPSRSRLHISVEQQARFVLMVVAPNAHPQAVTLCLDRLLENLGCDFCNVDPLVITSSAARRQAVMPNYWQLESRYVVPVIYAKSAPRNATNLLSHLPLICANQEDEKLNRRMRTLVIDLGSETRSLLQSREACYVLGDRAPYNLHVVLILPLAQYLRFLPFRYNAVLGRRADWVIWCGHGHNSDDKALAAAQYKLWSWHFSQLDGHKTEPKSSKDCDLLCNRFLGITSMVAQQQGCYLVADKKTTQLRFMPVASDLWRLDLLCKLSQSITRESYRACLQLQRRIQRHTGFPKTLIRVLIAYVQKSDPDSNLV